MAILIGVHPVIEALRAHHSLERILISKGAGGPRLQEIIDLARQSATPVRFEDRGALDRLARTRSHQGVLALGAEMKYAVYEATVGSANLVVVLDGVEDPHNLGAVVRTAHAAGAGALVVPERRAAGLTETVAKAAAGALEYLPVTRVTNINRTLEDLKKRGFWIYGVDERGTEAYNQIAWTAPAAIVLGGEGKGLHEQVRRHCDLLVRIPMAGKISSLNVSVAAGIALFAFRAAQKQ